MGWLLIWKLGVAVSATIMMVHAVVLAVEVAQDAHHEWCASRNQADGKRDR
jgi:hypothetical protein